MDAKTIEELKALLAQQEPAAIHDFLNGPYSRHPEGRLMVLLLRHRAELIAAVERERWIPVAEGLPEDRQNIDFIARCRNPSFAYLDGRFMGGKYIAESGFSIPGLTIDAYFWRPAGPLPLPPAGAE